MVACQNITTNGVGNVGDVHGTETTVVAKCCLVLASIYFFFLLNNIMNFCKVSIQTSSFLFISIQFKITWNCEALVSPWSYET